MTSKVRLIEVPIIDVYDEIETMSKSTASMHLRWVRCKGNWWWKTWTIRFLELSKGTDNVSEGTICDKTICLCFPN